MRAIIASAMPVLPEDGSMIVRPSVSVPSASASWIMFQAMRSLMDPPGFCPSSLATIRTSPFGLSWLPPTFGVSVGPEMVARIDGVDPGGRRGVAARVEDADPTCRRIAAEQPARLVGQAVVGVADDLLQHGLGEGQPRRRRHGERGYRRLRM